MKIGLLLWLLAGTAWAQELTALDRSDIYKACFTGCVPEQRASVKNGLFPSYVLEAYCSCICARGATRMTLAQARSLTPGVKPGWLLKEQNANAQMCQRALDG